MTNFTEWVEINGIRIEFYYSESCNKWVSSSFRIGQTDIEELYLPPYQAKFPDRTAEYIQFLFDHFDYFEVVSIDSLSDLAKRGKWFKAEEKLNLELLWVEICSSSYRASYIDLDLCFSETEKDIYGNWVSKFRNTLLRGVERKDA